jgi:hypothetical protein
VPMSYNVSLYAMPVGFFVSVNRSSDCIPNHLNVCSFMEQFSKC